MATFPAAAYVADAARTGGTQKTAVEAWLAATKQLPGGQAEESLTLATDVIVPTGSSIVVDTEAAAATDDLKNITTTNLPAGSLIRIRCADAARVITVWHNAGGAGQIATLDSAKVVLDNPLEVLTLVRVGADWVERGRTVLNRLQRVKVFTNVLASPLVGVPSDVGKMFVQTGVAAKAYYTLPPAVVGSYLEHLVQDTDGVRIVAAGTDVIREVGTTSTAGGYIESTTVGAYARLVCVIAGTWDFVAKTGTWSAPT